MSEPWGTDVHSALVWAFNSLARSTLPLSIWDRLHAPDFGSLSPVEARVQAAMIRHTALATKQPEERSLLVVTYLPPAVVLRRAGGGKGEVDYWRRARELAMEEVAVWLAERMDRNVNGCRELARQYVHMDNGFNRLRRALRIDRNMVDVTRHMAYAHLHELRKTALAGAEARLQAARLIPE